MVEFDNVRELTDAESTRSVLTSACLLRFLCLPRDVYQTCHSWLYSHWSLFNCISPLRTCTQAAAGSLSVGLGSRQPSFRHPIPIDSGFVLRIGPTQVVDRIIGHRRDRQVSRGEHTSNQRFSLADRRVVVLVGMGIDSTGDIYENSVDDTQDIIDQGADLICF